MGSFATRVALLLSFQFSLGLCFPLATVTRFERSALRASSSTYDSPVSSRRDLLIRSGGFALSTLISGISLPTNAIGIGNRTIVVTGSNSGIGLEACKRLALQGHTLILACRTLEKAEEAASKLVPYGGKVIPSECDLASLQSIERFTTILPNLVGNGKIDTLCLNAGIALNTATTECARTEDGFELTVGTNHFGHFYLNHLLLPQINPQGGRIVVTASGVHDPESPGGAQGVPAGLGGLQGLENQGKRCEMIDGSSFNADKAYKDSKLCNVLFTRELQRRLDMDGATKGITVNCFNPGLIVSTGLFRYQNPFFTKIFDFAATELFRVGETPEWGGGCLAYMTDISTKGLYYSSAPGSSKYGDAAYGNQFAPTGVSKEAADYAKAKKLWKLSAKELGIPL